MSDYARLVTQLIDAGRRIVAAGLVQGSAGNLSARLPGGDRYVVTKTGRWLDELTPGDFVTGSVAAGTAERHATIEWRLHHRTYAARPDAAAIVHLHPHHALLLAALDQPVRCITLDHQVYLGSVRRVPFRPAGSDDLARSAAEASVGCDAVILDHHGSSTIGDSVRMALRRALVLEDAAAMTYQMLLAGDRDTAFPPAWAGRAIDA
ncbi:MAG: class II aldolase/adducin family protein [Dermatophilaceae bacterium]